MNDTGDGGGLRVLAVGNVYPPHLLGGYEVIWQGVTRALAGAGHRARILTTGYRRTDLPPEAEDDPDVHRELDWYWHDHAWRELGPVARLALERRNAAIFERHLAEFQPDVLAWWAVGGMSLGLLERGRRAGIPSLLFVLDPWPSYGPERDSWTRMWSHRPRFAALAERLTGLPTRPQLAAAGRWLFCSESMRRDVLATGLAIADQAILSPGVASAFVEQPRELEPPPWSWRLLYVGRVVEQKGVRTAIEALAHLPGAARLRIVGEGDEPYRRGLEREAERLGVADRVAFEPPRGRAEVVDVYREADAVVFPVEWAEPWGLVPLEAMALGRPVVATGRGGSGDFLRHRENALLFEAGDPRALAGALSALAADAELRARLVRGGYAAAETHGEDEFNRRAVAEIEAAARR